MAALHRLAVGAAALALLSSGAIPSAAAAAPALSDHGGAGMTPVSEVVHGDGTVTDTWTFEGRPIIVVGARGVTISATYTTVHGIHQLSVAASLPAAPKDSKSRSQPAGWPRSFCTYLNPSNGHAQACDWQNVVNANGGDWYLSDELTMSANYGHGFFDPSLRWIYNYIAWTGGNSVVRWSPNSSGMNVGNCQTATVGASYFVSVSDSFQVCPDQWGLYTLSSTQFGAMWAGQSQSTRGVDSVDIVHSPPSVCSCSTLHTAMGWS